MSYKYFMNLNDVSEEHIGCELCHGNSIEVSTKVGEIIGVEENKVFLDITNDEFEKKVLRNKKYMGVECI